MRILEIDRCNITEDIIDRVLFRELEDCGENADCIVVLGSIKAYRYRIPIAVEAYLKGRAPKILLSGGAIRDFDEGRMTEAEHMRMHAINMGVAPEDVLFGGYIYGCYKRINPCRHQGYTETLG